MLIIQDYSWIHSSGDTKSNHPVHKKIQYPNWYMTFTTLMTPTDMTHFSSGSRAAGHAAISSDSTSHRKYSTASTDESKVKETLVIKTDSMEYLMWHDHENIIASACPLATEVEESNGRKRLRWKDKGDEGPRERRVEGTARKCPVYARLLSPELANAIATMGRIEKHIAPDNTRPL